MIMKTLFITFLAAIITCGNGSAQTRGVDDALQAKVEEVLKSGVEKFGAKAGQTVVMETKTGRILAAAGDGLTAPHGSTLVKAAVLSAALETGKVGLDDIVDTGNGVIKTKDGKQLQDHNWHRGGYGKISVRQGLACLSNIATYKTVQNTWGKDAQAFLEALDGTGYGRACTVAGFGELSKAGVSETGCYADITPLQTLAFFNAVANNSNGKESTDSLKSALRHCVTDGLCNKAGSDKVPAAGLAGTMQADDGSYWLEFCGYFPAENPRYTVIVTLNKDELPASSSIMAAPIFKDIAEMMTEEK